MNLWRSRAILLGAGWSRGYVATTVRRLVACCRSVTKNKNLGAMPYKSRYSGSVMKLYRQGRPARSAHVLGAKCELNSRHSYDAQKTLEGLKQNTSSETNNCHQLFVPWGLSSFTRIAVQYRTEYSSTVAWDYSCKHNWKYTHHSFVALPLVFLNSWQWRT